MAEVLPFRALHYDPASLQDVTAPPYDVIDAEQRAALLAQSPHNVVEIDLPQGDDPYAHAAQTFANWQREGVLSRDDAPALWALTQDYTGPDGRGYTRRGFFARVRVEEYGPGRVRPHERTHPGPKEDRLRLTRATQANLSPIFALYDDPAGAAWAAVDPGETPPLSEVTDPDGTVHRLWRVGDPAAHEQVRDALAQAELLIADGHHRYETARVYAEEIGGEGGHRYVLTCLVSLQDTGLTVFPTHRLLTDLKTTESQLAVREAIMRDWDVEEISADELEPTGDGPLRLGYMDSFHRRAYRLTLKDPAIADDALAGKPEPYRRLDTAVLEALILKGALGMTEDDISHLHGLDYARSTEEARRRIETGDVDAGFFMRGTPVAQVRDVAAAGENMPPKSTYFFPKVLTGMVFHLLD
jgi:uncharacterized protein (DUF1015 family)